ncbi:GL22492 [Drosophila persimilis]|uniref:GL22492 n=1 Tax=Drosophila persimilis TaxID=7234 RepID=B4H1F0_DROPE|nr:GL22492 [Drosophila persimilis]
MAPKRVEKQGEQGEALPLSRSFFDAPMQHAARGVMQSGLEMDLQLELEAGGSGRGTGSSVPQTFILIGVQSLGQRQPSICMHTRCLSVVVPPRRPDRNEGNAAAVPRCRETR